LLDHCLQDRHWDELPATLDGRREFDTGLVVVFGARKRGKASSFARSVVESDADGAVFEGFVDVETVALVS
jgi:hypothetical protein